MNSRRIIGVVLAMFLGLTNLKAQTLEIWGGSKAEALQTVGDVTYSHKNTTVILLEGDVEITGTITVDNWTSLRILNLTGEEHTIKNGIAGRRNTPLFEVINGAKLAFNYIDVVQAQIFKDAGIVADGDWTNMVEGNTKYAPINLDGGATWASNGQGEEFYVEEIADGVKKGVLQASNDVLFYAHSGMIESFGALEFFKVNIRNFHGQDYFGASNNDRSGVIMLSPRNTLNELTLASISGTPAENVVRTYKYRYTHLKCCLVEKCKSRTGVFLSVDTAKGNSQAINGTEITYSYIMTPNAEGGPEDLAIEAAGIVVEDCTIRNCVVYGDANGWGGLIRCKGGTSHHLTLRNTTFEENFSHGDGAGIWWNAGGDEDTKCIIDGCTFKNNRAMREAGALRMEASFEFTGGKTLITGNECYGLVRETETSYIKSTKHNGNGAGINIRNYSATAYDVGGELNYQLNNLLEITNNYAAGQGGGISFEFNEDTKITENSTITANFNGLTVSGNRAGMEGGGIFFDISAPESLNLTFNIQLNAGTIEKNEAPQGGGISANKINIAYDSENSHPVTIADNQATAGSGGGIFLAEGNITLDQLNITGNSSRMEEVPEGVEYGGGGVYVRNGSFNIETGLIQGNSSGMYGGGVFVYNSTDLTNSVALSGGDIKLNEAPYGGGLAAYGNLELAIKEVNIENNTAFNGGGIFLRGTDADGIAKLKYHSGVIRYNRANADNGQSLETAYGLSHKEMSGMGGGFYIGSYAELAFAAPENFGIYSNLAANGADDLFGYHSNVVISLPNVQKLKLDGYEGGAVADLFWGEDYITNDPNYDKGLKLKGAAWDTDMTNQRFRDVFRTQKGNYFTIEFDEDETEKVYENKYLCLTLIWHEDYLLLVKKGMKTGENAIFNVYNVDEDGNDNLYVNVMLTDADTDENGDRSKKITLKTPGIYKIVELPWAWAYDVDQSEIQKTVGQNSSEEDRTFTFTNTPKESAPIHDESLKKNIM